MRTSRLAAGKWDWVANRPADSSGIVAAFVSFSGFLATRVRFEFFVAFLDRLDFFFIFCSLHGTREPYACSERSKILITGAVCDRKYRTTARKLRSALRTVETSSYTYLGVVWRSRSFAKSLSVPLSVPLKRFFISLFETCEFNNVNILKFLLSRETTLEGLLKLAGRRATTSRGARVNDDCKLNHTAFGSSDTQNPGHDDCLPPRDHTDFSSSNRTQAASKAGRL